MYEQAGSGGTVLRLDVGLTLARAHREAGQLQLASSCLDQATQTIADGAIHRSIENTLLLEQGALAYANGQYELALETYWRSAHVAAVIGDRSREARSHDGTGQALRVLGRPGEAVDFHTQAAAVHRRLADSWQLALTQSHLAEALADLGRTQDSDASRAEARSLIEGFDDPRAAQLRNRLNGAEGPMAVSP